MYLNIPGGGDGDAGYSVRLPAHAQNNRLWMTWLRREGGLNGWSLTNAATSDNQVDFGTWYDDDMRQSARQFRADEQDRMRNMPGARIGRPATMAENRAEFGRQLRQTHPHISPIHFAMNSVVPAEAWGATGGRSGAPPALLRPDVYHSMHQRLMRPASGMQFTV